MKTKLIKWLISLLQPKFTVEQIKRINTAKNLFEMYFNGFEDEVEPQSNLSTFSLGITNFEFEFKSNLLVMTVTLLRPGLLIGKRGSTIEGLTKYLTSENEPVEIKIKESKLWNSIK
jgi:hypothetical protein